MPRKRNGSCKAYPMWGACLFSLLIFPEAVFAEAGGKGICGEIALVLEDGLGHGPKGTPLLLFAKCGAERVYDVWAQCPGYNQNQHKGIVVRSAVAAAAVEAEIDLIVHPDPFVQGGRG
jgi:hypothetical protein